jgi:hypothetical protein
MIKESLALVDERKERTARDKVGLFGEGSNLNSIASGPRHRKRPAAQVFGLIN